MSWSSGKDSAFSLAQLRADPDVEVTGLLVTLRDDVDRVSMHGVRRSLVEAQAERLTLPLHIVGLPAPCPNDVYEAAMRNALAEARRDGVDTIGFGDLFLADIREYRERALAGTGVAPRFPLWRRPTDRLARDMLGAGVRAVITTVDPSRVPAELAGCAWDEALLAALPSDVDPCGEHGEFHTFVWDAPGFSSPIAIEVGDVVTRDHFVYCDLRPGAAAGTAA
jgi:diphthamide synthase (EF-2-diphthine--ammonia ligase)